MFTLEQVQQIIDENVDGMTVEQILKLKDAFDKEASQSDVIQSQANRLGITLHTACDNSAENAELLKGLEGIPGR